MFISKQVGIACIGMLVAPLFSAYADEVHVVNNLSVRASSGGSRVSPGGQVSEGDQETSVTITTSVDGEVLDEFHERATSTPIVRKYTVTSTSPASARTVVHMQAQKGGQSSTDAPTAVDGAPTPPESGASSTPERLPISNRSNSAEFKQYATTLEAPAPLASRIAASLTRALLYVIHFFSY